MFAYMYTPSVTNYKQIRLFWFIQLMMCVVTPKFSIVI